MFVVCVILYNIHVCEFIIVLVYVLDFKDKEKSGDDIYVANPKESLKSLAQQLGYIK